jgi:hypothetical protein
VTGKSDGLSIHRRESLPPRRSPLRSPFFPLSTQPSIASAVCYPGTTSSLWAFRRGKLLIFFRPVKDNLGLKTPGVYSIPCECGQVYIGRTSRSIDTRIKENHRHIRLAHSEKSPPNKPTKKLTKEGDLRRRKTSSLARLNHSCVRNA